MNKIDKSLARLTKKKKKKKTHITKTRSEKRDLREIKMIIQEHYD